MRTIELTENGIPALTLEVDDADFDQRLQAGRLTAQLKTRDTDSEWAAREKPSQPFPSWTYVDGKWTAPTPRPSDTAQWDEDTLSWVEPQQS